MRAVKTGCVLLRRGDADAQAGEFLSAEVFDDVFDAVVSGCGRIGGDLVFSQWQIEFVLDDEDVVGGEFVEIHEFADGYSGKVHEGLRFDEQDFLAAQDAFGDFGVELLVEGKFRKRPRLAEGVEDYEADIVPRVFVLFAGVAQADDEFHEVVLMEKAYQVIFQDHKGVQGIISAG